MTNPAMFSAGASSLPQPAGLAKDAVWYASNNLIIQWKENKPRLAFNLGSAVTCVEGNGDIVAAGTRNGDLFVMNQENKTHVGNLNSAVFSLAVNDSLLVAGAAPNAKGEIFLYSLKSLESVRTFSLKGVFFPMSLALCGSLLAIGGTSDDIIVRDMDSDQQIRLKGHENWVRGLDFYDHDENLVLASGSHDKYIRLWRFSRDSIEANPLRSNLSTKVHRLSKYNVFLEALLMGHDDWVFAVKWDPHQFRLLSASSDASLIVWAPENTSHEEEGYDLWTPQVRLGDLSILGASTATGASGGFWGAYWLKDRLATVTRSGSWRVWRTDTWEPAPGISGHAKEVTWVAWQGDYLLSTSLDQTTRLWKVSDTLREVARPQIHGYDMVCCESVDTSKFISAGDEKTLRVFELPQSVAELLKNLGQPLADANLPAASVPALSLSNKSRQESTSLDLAKGQYPLEEQLQRLTLWPEIEKLYGHGYEINCVDVSPNKDLVATCCKANNPRHAVVRIYSTDQWRQLEPLAGHDLTVTRVKFSPNGKLLLTVSRDRQWIIYDVDAMTVMNTMPKAHTRIIWDCAWLSNDTFVTVSRDKTVKIWNTEGSRLGTKSFEHPVTAVDTSSSQTLVIGLENGEVYCADTNLDVLAHFYGNGRVNRLAVHGNLVACATMTLNVFQLPTAQPSP